MFAISISITGGVLGGVLKGVLVPTAVETLPFTETLFELILGVSLLTPVMF